VWVRQPAQGQIEADDGDFYNIYVTTVSYEQDWDCYVDDITPVYTTEKNWHQFIHVEQYF
jgi:hypothetical protein